jgi:hypothetical protein
MRYEARVGPWAHMRWARPRTLEIWYEYPYHRARFEWSNIEGGIAYWTFLLPLDERTTRVFFVFCYDRLRVAWLPFALGHGLVRMVLRLIQPAVRRLLDQDGLALEAERGGVGAPFRPADPGTQPRRGAGGRPDGRQVGALHGGGARRRFGLTGPQERPGGPRRLSSADTRAHALNSGGTRCAVRPIRARRGARFPDTWSSAAQTRLESSGGGGAFDVNHGGMP